MQWKNWGVKGGVAVVLMAAVVGCTPVRPVTPEAEGETSAETTTVSATTTVSDTGTGTVAGGETYSDPFAYCAAVGTLDEPDARYTGEAVPDVIAEGIRA